MTLGNCASWGCGTYIVEDENAKMVQNFNCYATSVCSLLDNH
jgi:hypothetical protein